MDETAIAELGNAPHEQIRSTKLRVPNWTCLGSSSSRLRCLLEIQVELSRGQLDLQVGRSEAR